MCEVIFILYNRSDGTVAIAQVPAVVYADSDEAALEYADPRAAHEGASIKGIFYSWEDAADAAKSYAKRTQ